MAQSEGRNYFVVRHDLASLQQFPGHIWNSERPKPPATPPVGFHQVRKGARWIAFAHVRNDSDEKAVSEVTGFYECIDANPSYRELPRRVAAEAGAKHAWVIRGKPVGPKLSGSVVVPPLSQFLGKNLFNQRTITSISKQQFLAISSYVAQHRFNAASIPGLHRDPRNEQEVLTIIAADPARFGIEKIVKVQTHFPDMTVKLKGQAEVVHLELELSCSSFTSHGHAGMLRHGRFAGGKKAEDNNHPVGVLCWINDDRDDAVGRHVNHRIFELRDLLKRKDRIRW